MKKNLAPGRAIALVLLSNFFLFALVSCHHTQVNFVNNIHEKDLLFQSVQPLHQPAEIQQKKLQDHLAILKQFNQNPDEFARKVIKKERHYLFDGVVDPEVTIRVGHLGDGGKWICNPQRLGEKPVIYSIGVGEDISFDTDMAGLFGAQVFMFDPNPEVSKNLPPKDEGYECGAGRLFYQAVGLGPVSAEKGKEWELTINGQRCPAKSLADLAASLGHQSVDILKMDIEGGEYAALHQILSAGTLNQLGVKMILVEFHIWDDGLFKDFLTLINSLTEQDYLIYRKEFNATNIKCAEYAFVHKSFLQ
ncbi:MAG: FkbM family methyltransferase [Acidobacteriota bacterium]|nr:FkbM family methyltransferase [Acidobacteriota bacterium]